MIKLSERLLLIGYTAGFTWLPRIGVERDHDPDIVSAYVYLFFFGFGFLWCREGWITTAEAARKETALQILADAPDPQVQTPTFLEEWDRLDRDGCR
jgi:hypothetical protein